MFFCVPHVFVSKIVWSQEQGRSWQECWWEFFPSSLVERTQFQIDPDDSSATKLLEL